MDDLLASIRKAIHDDVGQFPARPPEPVFRGTMRELRVRTGTDATSAAAEIQELRDKITRTRLVEPERPVPARRAEPSPPMLLRPSFAETDFIRTLDVKATVAPPPREAPVPLPPPMPEPRPATADASLLSAEASAAAGAAFNRLADTLLSRAAGERSIEDLARDMLRGMLKTWLDDNLPALVEKLVREEIERVARRGR